MADIIVLDEHRECEPLFDVRVYRHPNGDIMGNVIAAYAAWFAETKGASNVERMQGAATLVSLVPFCMRRHAQELRNEGAEIWDTPEESA